MFFDLLTCCCSSSRPCPIYDDDKTRPANVSPLSYAEQVSTGVCVFLFSPNKKSHVLKDKCARDVTGDASVRCGRISYLCEEVICNACEMKDEK